MSSTAAVEIHGAHAEHHELGFVRTYLFSTDHKMIAKQFLFVALFMMSIGGLMAMLMRLELGWPESQWSFLSIFPQTLAQDNAITPNTYNSMFTMHATIMIFFVAMPILVGTFGNLLVPLMIGARDMAFPLLNLLSFWVSAVAGVIMVSSFFVPGGAAAAGWTSYAPLSAVPNYTGVDWGQNLWCISIIVLGIGSLMGSINYITTIINMRTKGMISSVSRWSSGHCSSLRYCCCWRCRFLPLRSRCCFSIAWAEPISSCLQVAASRYCGSICSGFSAIPKFTS